MRSQHAHLEFVAIRATALLAVVGMATGVASAQSFGLDDAPSAPIVGSPGPGHGAEDPYGFGGPPLAPSPSLGIVGPTGDGAILMPGGPMVMVQHPGPNGYYISAFSTPHRDNLKDITIDFSVDRVTRGFPGTAVRAEFLNGQAHGDLYTVFAQYTAPGVFAGTLGPGPFAGFLPSIVYAPGVNNLVLDESWLGMVTPLGNVPPGVPVPSPFNSPGRHDNMDSFDHNMFEVTGDNIMDSDGYFAIYPAEAFPLGVSPADLFAFANGDSGAVAIPYAPAQSMGLDPFEDTIDGLVMYDHNLRPIPLSLPGSPGRIEPVIDYALFSLAPGSASLQFYGLDAADVFFTDFTGAFAVYAPTPTLGLVPTPPGFPWQGENIDALEVTSSCIADINGDGILDNGDIGAFVNLFLAGSPAADLNGDGILDNGDIGAFVFLFLAGCG